MVIDSPPCKAVYSQEGMILQDCMIHLFHAAGIELIQP